MLGVVYLQKARVLVVLRDPKKTHAILVKKPNQSLREADEAAVAALRAAGIQFETKPGAGDNQGVALITGHGTVERGKLLIRVREAGVPVTLDEVSPDTSTYSFQVDPREWAKERDFTVLDIQSRAA